MKMHKAILAGLILSSPATGTHFAMAGEAKPGVGVAAAEAGKGAVTDSAQKKPAPTGIRWVGSMKEINEQATTTGKPILAYFFMKTCPVCKMLNQGVLVDPGVTLLAEEFVACGFDYQKDVGMVETYNVAAYPTLIFANAQGRKIDNVVGFQDPNELSFTMAKLLARYSLPRLQKAAEAKPDDLRALSKLAIAYAAKPDIDKAEELFSKVTEADPDNEQDYWLPIERALAKSLFDRGKYQRALPYLTYQVSNTKEPYEVAQANYRLAFACMATKQYEQAAAPLDFVLQSDETYISAGQKRWATEQIPLLQ